MKRSAASSCRTPNPKGPKVLCPQAARVSRLKNLISWLVDLAKDFSVKFLAANFPGNSVNRENVF